MTATAVGVFAVALVVTDTLRIPNLLSDLDQIWLAARLLADGHDPYSAIGPARDWTLPFDFYYPLTAPLLLWPIRDQAPLTIRIVFVGLSAWIFAFAVTREGLHRLPIFLSGAFMASVRLAQWTPLYGAVFTFPWIGFVLAAKPNAGVAVLAASRSGRDLIIASTSALLLTVLSSILWPGWIQAWLATVRTAEHFIPTVALPGGFIMLLALLRWRSWKARLLLALAVVPQTPGLVPTLLLLVIPRTFKSAAVLSLLTFIPYFFAGVPADFADFAKYARAIGILTLWTAYIPALLLVLMEPTEGRVAIRLERLLDRVPSWIRSASSSTSAEGETDQSSR